ncbi:MAG TPA: hypothetical protein QF753_00010 [Victivallales bacterium]|nr:hypothetical protein [Victivallales bacterium]
MRKFHHIGIPTENIEYKNVYYKKIKGYATPFKDSEYGVEWVKFLKESHLPDLVKNKVHIAFEIDSFEEELKGKKILVQPYDTGEGFAHAFIEHFGIAVELMLFTDNK